MFKKNLFNKNVSKNFLTNFKMVFSKILLISRTNNHKRFVKMIEVGVFIFL